MEAPRVQVVWAHPREDSLTANIVEDVESELRAGGAEVEVLDLYRIPFDPVLREADEPDWENLDKEYSPEVMRLIDRTREATKIVFVFPVWWYSFPAIMKGYIDRVWNHGYFYGGGRRLGFESVLWIGLVGFSREAFRKRNYDEMMEHYLKVGIAEYCGAQDSRVELLYNTLGEGVADMDELVAELREQAREAARQLLRQEVPSPAEVL